MLICHAICAQLLPRCLSLWERRRLGDGGPSELTSRCFTTFLVSFVPRLLLLLFWNDRRPQLLLSLIRLQRGQIYAPIRCTTNLPWVFSQQTNKLTLAVFLFFKNFF